MNGGPEIRDAQRRHWHTTFQANPHLYGTDPSAPGAYAVELFGRERVGARPRTRRRAGPRHAGVPTRRELGLELPGLMCSRDGSKQLIYLERQLVPHTRGGRESTEGADSDVVIVRSSGFAERFPTHQGAL